MDIVQRALDEGTDCTDVLQLMAAGRGGMNDLMAELMQKHLCHHVLYRRTMQTLTKQRMN